MDVDSGRKASYLKIGMLVFIVIGLCLVYFLIHFKGLGTEQAMDQAQIARALVSGEGFTTRYIRPLAIHQLLDTGKKVPSFRYWKQSRYFPSSNALIWIRQPQ